MKSFKQFIRERAIDAVKIVDFLEKETIEYIDVYGNRKEKPITVVDLHIFVNNNFDAKDLGEGSYGITKKGAVGEDYILKVSKRADEAYEQYAKYAIANHNKNPLYPHILYTGTLPYTHDVQAGGATVYLIEHLVTDPYSQTSDYSSFRLFRYANLIYRLCNKMEPFRYHLDENGEPDVHDGMEFLKDRKIHKHKFEKVIQRAGLLDSIENLGIRIKNLEAWLTDYNRYFSGGDGSYFLDLHEGNIGWRKNGQCVFFDPIAKVPPEI